MAVDRHSAAGHVRSYWVELGDQFGVKEDSLEARTSRELAVETSGFDPFCLSEKCLADNFRSATLR